MRNLNLDQLRTFLEVVRLGSFTAAGRSLNLTQPAISQQIKELEGRLGVQLITESEETVNAIQRYRDGWLSPVRLGTTITVCVYLLPKLLGELRQVHPELDVSIEVDLSSVVVEKVARNELDFGLVALPIDKAAPIEVTRIREDPMMAV